MQSWFQYLWRPKIRNCVTFEGSICPQEYTSAQKRDRPKIPRRVGICQTRIENTLLRGLLGFFSQKSQESQSSYLSLSFKTGSEKTQSHRAHRGKTEDGRVSKGRG
jgi:hypothetical protein